MPNKRHILLFVITLLLIITEYVFHNQISNILGRELSKEIQTRGLNVSFENADYGYLPPRLILDTVSYKGNSILLSAEQISLSIRLLPLIKGNIEPGSLIIKKATTSIKLATSSKSSKKPFSFENLNLSKVLDLIPLDKVSLINSKAILLINEDVIDLKIETVSIEKLYSKIQIEAQAIVNLRTKALKDSFHLNTKLRWQENGFFISFFTLQKENSIVQLSGSIKEEILKHLNSNQRSIYQDINEIRAQVNLDLAEFNNLLIYLTKNQFPPKTPIKNFSGRIQASGYYYDSEETSDQSILNLQADNLKTPFVSLNSLVTKGILTNTTFFTESVKIQLSEKSSLNINQLKLKRKNQSILISADLKTDFLKIEDILSSLNLQSGGLYAPVTLDTHCGGSLKPSTLIQCNGNGSVIKLSIGNPSKSNKIFSINSFTSSFKSTLTDTELIFSSNASRVDPESKIETKGSVSGTVNYVSGFEVEFETDPIDLNFVNEIAGQKFSGLVSLAGTSKGSSKWGTINTQLNGENFQFNELFVGMFSADLEYKLPNLFFKNIRGNILEGSNSYSGRINLNVDTNDLALNLKGLGLTDLGARALFGDLFTLPEKIKFDSNFSLSASNGVDINKMDLDFKAQLTNLDLFDEHFIKGDLHLKGTNGDWKIIKGLLSKDSSSFKATGELKGLKSLDTNIVSENFKIQNSDFLKTLGLKLTGPAKITLHAIGPLKGPVAKGTLSLTDTKGPRKNNMGNSFINYRLFEDTISFDGNAFKNSLSGKGSYPLSEDGKLSYIGEIKRLNLLSFLNINSENAPDTKLFLWAKPNFTVNNISKDAPKGVILDTRLELTSETQSLASLKQTGGDSFARPLKFELNQAGGHANLSFDFSKRHQKKISFNGALKLYLLKPFIPTCELIDGDFSSTSLKLISSPNGIKGFGSAKFTNGSFKTDSFPYSFNRISTNLDFVKNQAKLSNIHAALANTHVDGSGFIDLLNQKHFLNFDFSYKNLNIEFPPKITTNTNGKLNLSGNKLPLKLSGDLVVNEGLFSQDILSSVSSETINPNKLLPSQILKKSSPPAVLDVNVKIKNKMKIKNNEADGYAYGFIKAKGNPVDPVLNGNINLKQGLIISFNDKDFVLNEGHLRYNNNLVTNPEISIDATSKLKDNNDPLEKIYTLRMLIKGSAGTPDIKFSSQPFLEENQIISLLTIGTVSTQSIDQEITTTEQAAYSGLQFGSYLIQKNQALKDLQKQTGTQIGLSSSVNSDGVNPKVFVKKSWTPKSSSTLSQTFGNQKNLSFTTEYKLNKKTSTVFGIQNNQTDDASQLNSRRVQQGVILDLGLQYKFEFD